VIARWQLYLFVAAAFVLGVLGIRARWLAEGEERARGKMETQRRKAVDNANEVRNEVEAFDRDTLRGRATIWVRGTKR
jgi:hypothetical protein